MIVNKEALNKYGEEKGYKIMPSRGPAGMHLTIANSTNLAKSGAIGTHGYFVTKQVCTSGDTVSGLDADRGTSGRKMTRNGPYQLGTPMTRHTH